MTNRTKDVYKRQDKDRKCVQPAIEKAEETGAPAVAIELCLLYTSIA